MNELSNRIQLANLQPNALVIPLRLVGPRLKVPNPDSIRISEHEDQRVCFDIGDCKEMRADLECLSRFCSLVGKGPDRVLGFVRRYGPLQTASKRSKGTPLKDSQYDEPVEEYYRRARIFSAILGVVTDLRRRDQIRVDEWDLLKLAEPKVSKSSEVDPELARTVIEGKLNKLIQECRISPFVLWQPTEEDHPEVFLSGVTEGAGQILSNREVEKGRLTASPLLQTLVIQLLEVIMSPAAAARCAVCGRVFVNRRKVKKGNRPGPIMKVRTVDRSPLCHDDDCKIKQHNKQSLDSFNRPKNERRTYRRRIPPS